MINWGFMDFQYQCKTDTYLFSLKKMLADRHGRIKSLKLMITRADPEKEMEDELDMNHPTSYDDHGNPKEKPVVRLRKLSEFLEQEGIAGRPRSECGKVVVQIYYDFKPEDAGPILLDWNIREDRVSA
jgi:hypothetical protein